MGVAARQQGAHPDELTQVSDSGKRTPLTTLRRSGKNRFPKVMGVAARQQGAHPDELT
ncbi:TPA: hypothetical protein ACT48M_001827 [Yersinia enterocolitica]